MWVWSLYLYRLSPQYKEMLCPHHHKPHELLTENLLNLISLIHVQYIYSKTALKQKGSTLAETVTVVCAWLDHRTYKDSLKHGHLE